MIRHYFLKPLKDIQLRLEYLANPHKPEIVGLVGVSGSGKTTYSNELVKANKDFVRVNRDDIRSMLFGLSAEDHKDYYSSKDLNKKESVVTAVEDNIIMASLHEGKSVVVDATHLKMKYINRLKKFGHPTTLCIFTEPLEECIQRDANRERFVGEDIIGKQYKEFLILAQPENLNFLKDLQNNF